jgi:ribosome-associated protein
MTAIAEGQVTVDGRVELRKRCKIRKGQVVAFGDHTIKVI